MKINLNQLKKNLQNGLQPLYIITGDEPLLIDETCQYLRKVAKKNDFNERQSYTVTGRFKWDAVFSESQALSLFSEKKIIELHIPTGKPGRDGAAQLVELSSALNQDTMLIITLPKLTMSSQKAKWFQNLEKNGTVIEIRAIRQTELPQWLAKRLGRYDLQVSPAGLQLIANYCEGNLLAAKQAVERLSLLSSSGEITLEDIQASLSDNSHYDVYQLLDCILQQDSQRSMVVFKSLKASNTEASLMLWVLSKELRLLMQLSTALATHQPLNTLWRQYGVWQQRQPLLQKHLKSFSLAHYQQLTSIAHQADCALKGMSSHSIWDVLQNLVLSMSSPKLLSTFTNMRLAA
jgi:DNA polymerase-3 subunit delta